MANSLDDIVLQMQQVGISGITAGDLVPDGKVRRFRPDGARRGKKSGWYVLYEYTTAAGRSFITGAFGRGPDQYKVEVSRSGWSAEEREQFKAEHARRAREIQAERRAAAKAAAEKAQRLWDGARDSGTSAYLDRKRVRAFGTRFGFRESLMVPVRDMEGRLWSVQWILPDGSKRFTTDSEIRGHFHQLGAYDGTGWLVFAEGYATAASVHMAAGLPVVVAFDAGNLESVVEAFRRAHPSASFLVAGDDDRHLEQRLQRLAEELGFREPITVDGAANSVEVEAGKVFMRARWVRENSALTPHILANWTEPDGVQREREFRNAGREKALAVMKAHGCRVVFPAFADEAGTDFNDLHVARGIDAVRDQIEAAISADDAVPPAVDAAADAPDDPTLVAMVEALGEASEPASTPKTPSGKGGGRKPPPSTPGGPPEDPEDAWMKALQRRNGRLIASEFNAYTILLHHPDWQGVLGYDQFADAVYKHRPPPFQNGAIGYWTDLDDARGRLWISARFGIEIPEGSFIKAVLLVADRHQFHKLRAWLEGLQWDGTPRLGLWLRTYCGALGEHERRRLADDEFARLERYVGLVGVKWMVAAVARIFKPGCRVDNMMVLEGEQGQSKSTLFRTLAGEEWFSDAPVRFDDKDTYINMFGKWIIEMGELEALGKADASSAKRFLTQHVDRFRPFYGRRSQDVRRQCIFAGTVNHDVYLKDDSGNRRFWPVWTAAIDLPAIIRDREQLWAEAVQLFQAGTVWWVLPEERPLFVEQEDRRYQEDALQDPIQRYLDGKDEALGSARRDRVTVGELLGKALKIDAARWDKLTQQRVVSVMKRLGWSRKRESSGDRAWFYARPAAATVTETPPPRQREPGDDDEPF